MDLTKSRTCKSRTTCTFILKKNLQEFFLSGIVKDTYLLTVKGLVSRECDFLGQTVNFKDH